MYAESHLFCLSYYTIFNDCSSRFIQKFLLRNQQNLSLITRNRVLIPFARQPCAISISFRCSNNILFPFL
nr:MAG TPA: hypothetical protein [Caudoviricetes sp.]